MNSLKELIMALSAIGILGAFMDMVLPNGSLRKYSRFILGLIVLALIVQPILQLFGSTSSFGQRIAYYEASLKEDILNHQLQLMKALQEEQAKELFSEDLESRIEQEVKQLGDYDYVNAKLSFSKKHGQENLREIEKLLIEIGKAPGSAVEPIHIRVSVGTLEEGEQVQGPGTNSDEAEKIQRTISDLFDIPKDKIVVSHASG